MAMQWKYSNGYDTSEFLTSISFEDDAELAEEQKDLFVLATASAASKTLTLGLANGQPMFIYNAGDTNAFTAANLEGDSGQAIGTGELWLAFGSTTADGTIFMQMGSGSAAPDADQSMA